MKIEVLGANRFVLKIEQMSRMSGKVNTVLGEWANRQANRLTQTPYPPERPGQRYVRTYLLARSWNAEPINANRWRIINTAPYSGYVIGEKQAWMHAGRWWRALPTIIEDVWRLKRQLAQAYQDIWDR